MWEKIKNLWEKITGESSLRGLLIFLLVVLAVLFLIVVFDGCPRWTSQYLGISKKDEALKFLGIGMGGVILALQALIANRRAKAMESSAEAQAKAASAQADAAQAQADATKEQAKANENTERGQRQERLKNAIEHLGHSSDSVRLGGAYELFHLAEDTKELRQTVLDILCAHIRQTTGKDEYRKKYPSNPSEEVQSLLTLLFVQEHEIFKGCNINLQGSWLNGTKLNRARLEKAVLTGAYLQDAALSFAEMQEARLSECQFRKARLIEAKMKRAVLYRTQFQGAHLLGAQFQGAELVETQLQGAYLPGTRFQGADLYHAQFQGARLTNAQFQGVYLEGANLQGVSSQDEHFLPFETLLRSCVGKETDLCEVTFEGGLSQEDLDLFTQDLPATAAKEWQDILSPQVGKPESHELPQDSGAIIGAYTAEEAEKWISEYKKAMSEVPEENDN